MSDDWKGENKISAKPKSREERMAISLSAASIMAHRRRQRSGSNPSHSKEPWAVSIAKWHRGRKIAGDGLE